MKHIPLIRASILNGFVAFLEEIAAPTQRLLTQAKLPISALREPESLLPLKQVFEFYERAARSTGCDRIGLLVGQRMQLDDLGAFGRLIHHSLTLHDAIHTGIYMIATYNSGERFWLVEQGDRVWLCRDLIDHIPVGCQQADHCSIMVMLHLIQLAAGSEWRPAEVHLETRRMKGLHDVELLADTKILFNQESTAIAFPRSFLSLPLQGADGMQNSQRYKDYESLHVSAPATSFLGSVRQLVAALLKDGYPEIHIIAEMVGMSVRSLQRQLSESDLTYSRLIEQIRFERSVQLLRSPSIKLYDIAAELGYTDAANFTRAFRRWAGVSPSEFRELRWRN